MFFRARVTLGGRAVMSTLGPDCVKTRLNDMILL